MKAKSVLMTQCLQNDFVRLIEKYDPLPNLLHVGYEEARRLSGERIEEGPVNHIINWAYSQNEDDLGIIHIRDWHNPQDESQKAHLEQFGSHCIANTPGAEFIFEGLRKERDNEIIVDASGLNDFVDTNLQAVLDPLKGRGLKIGIAGVWTEAKIFFLCYDLRTRYPDFRIAVCTALTASSSRSMHFMMLDQIRKILDVEIFESPAAFAEFLTGSAPRVKTSTGMMQSARMNFEGNTNVLANDHHILEFLFRDCREVEFKTLDGGFSGNLVLKARARDQLGHLQSPAVIKVGPRNLIARERISFERIQEVLGNSAPSITDFVEIEDRGGIKYRYAAMNEGNVSTFQKLYMGGSDEKEIHRILDTVFLKQLGKLYEASSLERMNLLHYYDFQAKYAPSVRSRVNALVMHGVDDDEIIILPGVSVPNVVRFYERTLGSIDEGDSQDRYVAYLHGDLNGANIIVDDSSNVWLIDFFHTHRGHILKDLIKLENDLMYIFTKVENENEFKEAIRFSDELLRTKDLWAVPLESIAETFEFAQFQRAWRTMCKLRSYYKELIQLDRDPYQLYIAMLRYTMHTLSFDECNDWQKKWALYTGAHAAMAVESALLSSRALRVDYLQDIPSDDESGRIGITILPGRKDRGRNLQDDIQTILDEKISAVLVLVTKPELTEYGTEDLLDEYRKNGLEVKWHSITDQGIPAVDEMKETTDWMHSLLQKNKNVLVHCVGGLGRSGLAVSAYLMRHKGFRAAEAIAEVRKSRSPRAVENHRQEEFLEHFG